MGTANFRSQARVIDLLGREQIADAPTAIGELLKNSLDAAARNTWINFNKQNKVLTVRDDGLGMRTRDVKQKWLVVATDSKHGGKRDDQWLKYADAEQKRWLKKGRAFGEKGIGRLSVGVLGRSTFLWTVWGDKKEKHGTLCFIHWHLFRHPKLLFENIPIPLVTLKQAASSETLIKLVADYSKIISKTGLFADDSWSEKLRSELKQDLYVNLPAASQKIKLTWENGTTFAICDTSSNVEDLFLTANQVNPTDEPPPDVLKAYSTFPAFWNPFQVNATRPFSIHASIDGLEIGQSMREFWNRSDFQNADHHITISVSEDGFASGTLANFNKPISINYERQLSNLPPLHKSPGAFLVEIGYVKGVAKDSALPADEHLAFNRRLDLAGGFYVYVDNVRIQPYGTAEADFIGFEERRNKNSGRYYFSNRRMFGGLFLKSDACPDLKEKAGREGFQVNGAYRGLRFWLRELFLDLADSYYGGKSEEGKKQKERKKSNSKKTKERLDEQREVYLDSINLARRSLSDLEREIKPAVLDARRNLRDEHNGIPGLLLDKCREALERLRSFLNELEKLPDEPNQAFVIDEDDLEGIGVYLTKKHEAQGNLSREIAKLASDYQRLALRANIKKEHYKEIVNRIHESDRFVERVIIDALAPLKERIKKLESEIIQYGETEIKRLIDLRGEELGAVTAKDIAEDVTGEQSKTLERALEKQRSELRSVSLLHIEQMNDDLTHVVDKTSSAFIAKDYAEEISRLKGKVELLVEAAQLGLVLESATHEYENQLDTIKKSIEYLSGKLSGSEKSQLKSIEQSFEIIDERLRLFDPLLRRKTSAIQVVTGFEIQEFILRRFAKRELSADVFDFTASALSHEWHRVKRPVFLGAIHNLVLNAVYWSQKAPDRARIRFSISRGNLIISDNGPGVSPRDASRVFDPGFSRRPYGRGLGLYVAKESLWGIGYFLTLLSEPALGGLPGANFSIALSKDGHDLE